MCTNRYVLMTLPPLPHSLPRYVAVCHVAQETSAPHCDILTGRKKCNFQLHHLLSDWSKIYCRGAHQAGKFYIPNLKENSPAISEIRVVKVSL